MAKTFTHGPLHAVSFDGVTLRFYRNPESKMTEVIRNAEYRALAEA
jgi:hypothetical protein